MIDSNSNIQLYIQLKEEIINKINSNEYRDSIPSEDELSKYFKVSRSTVRSAVSVLVDEGYLFKKRGVGTFIQTQKVSESLTSNMGFKVNFEKSGQKIKTIECEIKELKRVLLEDKENIYEIKRVRGVEKDNIIVYSITNILTTLDIDKYYNEVSSSLYDLLYEQGIVIKKLNDEIEIIKADKEISEKLGIKEGSCIMKKTRHGYDENDKLIEESIAYYNPSNYKYKAEFKI